MIQKGMRTIRKPSLDDVYTAFNMEDPILGHLDPNDKGVTEAIKIRKEKYPQINNDKARAIRRALSMAYNRAKLIELFYNGRADPANGPIPPGLEGHDPEVVNPYTAYNPEGAKKLLADAGLKKGDIPPLKYQTSSGSTSVQMAEFRKKLYEKIGIDLEINTNTWPELNKKVKTKRAQIFGMAWSADYPDAQNFLQLFYSPNESPGTNGANYSNPEFDRLYEKIEVMLPGPERTKIYKQMAQIVRGDVPWSFDAHRTSEVIVHGWLKNFKPHDAGHGFWKFYKIDTELRKQLKPKL
jgi:ABC-type transport system substrate-binding protein